MHEVHTNQKNKFMRLVEVCKRMNMPERIPDKYSRAINFLAAVDSETFRKLERILEDADDITDVDVTYEKTVKLCLLAEARLKKRISAITMAKQLRGPVATPKNKEKELPEKDASNKEKKKEEMRKDQKNETDTDKHKWLPLPAKFKNLTPEQSDALSKKCHELNACKNCANHDKSWPSHKSY